MILVIKSLTALIVVASIFLFGIPFLLLSFGLGLGLYEIGSLRLIGIPPIVLGSAILLWCAINFATIGKGTPAPFDPPKKLVMTGLYRSVRNPMYLAAELVLVGQAMLFESLTILVYAALMWLIFHLFVVYYEEPSLKGKFGATYEEYCYDVPRWVPRRILPKRTE